MWGPGFGRSRDIQAQDVEKQTGQDKLGRFCCEEVWSECFVQHRTRLRRTQGNLFCHVGMTGMVPGLSYHDNCGSIFVFEEFLETVLGDTEAAVQFAFL